MNRRGGPPRPLAGFLPLKPEDVLAEAYRIHGGPAPYDPEGAAPPPAREPGCDDGDENAAPMDPGGTFPGDLLRLPSGHTRHCEARMKWGDGECECGARPAREPGSDDDQDAQAPGEAGHHERGSTSPDSAREAGAAPAEAAPASADPAPNSPGDAGYLDQEQLSAGVAVPAGSPAPAEAPPETRECRSCGARIYWVQLVDEHGARQRRDDGKGWKAMPVDAQPDPVKGNVYCYRPRGARALYGRVLRRDEAVPPGARLRTSHFATCKFADQHRRKRR